MAVSPPKLMAKLELSANRKRLRLKELRFAAQTRVDREDLRWHKYYEEQGAK